MTDTRYIFSTKEPQGEWVFQAPQDLGHDDPTTFEDATALFEDLRRDWTHIRVERLHDGRYEDVSNEIEQAIWDRDESGRVEAALDYAHERAESASWRYV